MQAYELQLVRLLCGSDDYNGSLGAPAFDSSFWSDVEDN